MSEPAGDSSLPPVRWLPKKSALFHLLGPGLIAGASNIDPTTVATLTLIGATTGYGLSWLVLVLIPLVSLVQVMSASVGTSCHASLIQVTRRRYGYPWALVTLLVLLGVNLITLAADLEGGGAALEVLTGWPAQRFVLPLACAVGLLLLLGTYTVLQRLLRAVLPVFLAYVVTTFLARPDWGQVLQATFLPQFHFTTPYVAGSLALLGTSLTSYVYIWVTIEQAHQRAPIRYLRWVQWEAGGGMALAGVVCWFIGIASGATLGAHHLPVETAQEAAVALVPLAGQFAARLFALGLLSSALLVVPILVCTNAYAFAETFGRPGSLDLPCRRAPLFYTVLLLSLAVGASVTTLRINAIQLLFLGSIAGGLGTPLTLALLLLAARDRQVMGEHRIRVPLAIVGWGVTGGITVVGVLYVWQTLGAHL